MRTECAVPILEDEIEATKEAITKEIAKSPISWGIARSIAGGMVGNLVDNTIDEDGEGLPIFTALGLLAGKPSIIRKTNLALSRVNDNMPEWLSRQVTLDDMAREQEILDAYGFAVDPRNNKAGVQVKNFLNTIRGSLQEGRDATTEILLKNKWVQSQFSELRALAKNIPQVNRLIHFLQDIPNQIKQFKTGLDSVYNEGKDADAFQNYLRQGGLDTFRSALAKVSANIGQELSISNTQAREEFGHAVARFLHTGKGGKNVQARKNVDDYYAQNPTRQALDEYLVQDPEFMEFVSVVRDWFSDKNRAVVQSYKELQQKDFIRIKSLVQNMDLEEAVDSRTHLLPYIEDFINSKMTWKQFKEARLNENDTTTFENLVKISRDKEDPVAYYFGRMINTQRRIVENTGLDGAYFPQYESNRIMQRLFAKMKQEGKVVNQQDFDDWVADRYWQLNKPERTYVDTDGTMNEMRTKHFTSRAKAEAKLSEMLSKNQGIYGVDGVEYASRNFKNFVREGKMEITKNGEKKQVTFYYIQDPDNAPRSFVQAHNEPVFKSYFRKMRHENSLKVKDSARLDHARKWETPAEFLETDVNSLLNSYSNDVAPRLFGIKNNVFDDYDLQREYFTPIAEGLQRNPDALSSASETMDNIKGIYSTAMRMRQFTDANDIKSFETKARYANRFRHFMASTYMWGISFYNGFENAVQTPLLTSWRAWGNTWKSFVTNPDEVRAYNDFAYSYKVMESHLKSHNGSVEIMEDVYGTGFADKVLEKSADYASDFSFNKFIGNAVGFDMNKAYENSGVWRIFLDGFMGGNNTSNSINLRATLYEAKAMGDALTQIRNLPEGEVKVATIGRRQVTEADAKRKLASYGITEDRLDGFLSEKTQLYLNDFMASRKQGQNVTVQEAKEHASELNHLMTIANYSTEAYQGTNQLFRPENYASPGGRVLATFSNYTYNQLLQNWKLRIQNPISDWSDKYAGQLSKAKIAQAHVAFMSGNIDSMKKMGYTQEMINEYPADAFNHIFKYFGIAVGVSVIGNTSVDVIRDLIAMPLQDEDDQWGRSKQRLVLNTWAKKSEQRTIGDVMEDFGSADILRLAAYFMGQTVDVGLAGRTDILFSRYGNRSLTDLTPVTRLIDDGYKDIQSVINGGLGDLNETTSKVAFKNALKYTPILGGSPLSEIRKVVQDDDGTKKERARNPQVLPSGSSLPSFN